MVLQWAVHSMVHEGSRIFSVMTEAHFNNHPEIKRSALINAGDF